MIFQQNSSSYYKLLPIKLHFSNSVHIFFVKLQTLETLDPPLTSTYQPPSDVESVLETQIQRTVYQVLRVDEAQVGKLWRGEPLVGVLDLTARLLRFPQRGASLYVRGAGVCPPRVSLPDALHDLSAWATRKGGIS